MDTPAAQLDPARNLARAGSSPRAWALLGVTVALAIAIDIASKYLAFHHVAGAPVPVVREEVLAATPRLYLLIPPHEPMRVVPGLLDFTLVLNPGAVFGIGAGKRWFFAIFTLVVVGAATWLFANWTTARQRSLHLAIGLVVGGGLGNLYDRLVYACVRDFLHPLPRVHLPFGLRWPSGSTEVWPWVSNLADLFLIIGVAILAYAAFRAPSPANEAPNPKA